jgi:L-rhamnose mutarotase
MAIRKAFLMKLKPGRHVEYARRHQPVWPEMETLLKEHGLHNYSIFHDPLTDQLFGYVEIESEELWNTIATSPVCRRWWAYMSEIMETNPDLSPVSQPLDEVFHLD